ncbi:MAG: phosphoribosylglycinamide formyltransferase [Hyphomicrobiales bacterium]|nr:phosphoribosylglycinamide formyltransferase [Hyphomicrobiales bacterium]
MTGRRRTAVLISGRGSNMQALVAAARAPDYPAEIALVVSNRPDAAGLDYARDQGIAAVTIDHKAYKDRASFEDALDTALGEHDIDLVACAGFMRILSPAFVEKWLGRLLNIHPSLLPAYRGLNTHERALADGASEHGCTVHFMVAELDAGPIIAQARVPVLEGDTADTLAARVLKAEHETYPQALASVASGEIGLN